jgi:hypothetical protein
MVLNFPRLGALLAACGALAVLGGGPHGARAQEPAAVPTPALPPPRFLDAPPPARDLPAVPTQGTAWIGIGLACSRCSFESEGKAIRRWIFSEPPAITMVDRRSPADLAGLRSGDSLIAVDGHTLVSAEGGEAFANLRPGVRVRLTYRRDGRERTASVTPVANPASAQMAEADSQYRAAMRAYARSTADAARQRELSLSERQRVQRQLERAQEVMRLNRGKVLDSASTQRMREALEQAQRALETQRGYSIFTPGYPRVAPVEPYAPVAPYAPAVPAPAPLVVSPGVPAPPSLGVPGGGLRYSGRLGETVIEARRPGRVTVVETGDSEVVLTGGDLSVRVARSPSHAVARSAGVVTAGFAAARSASGDEAAGIQGVVASPRLAEALGASSGVLVLDVQPRSHAESLGVRPGDVIVTLNGSPAVAVAAGRTALKRLRTAGGATTTARSAVVVRARERRALALTPAARSGPSAPAPARPPSPRPMSSRPLPGGPSVVVTQPPRRTVTTVAPAAPRAKSLATPGP